MLAKDEVSKKKVKITENQLLCLFKDHARLWVSFEIMDEYLTDMPLNDWVLRDVGNCRTNIGFIMLDFYFLLGNKKFRDFLEDEFYEQLNFVNEMSKEELYDESSYFVGKSMIELYDKYITDEIDSLCRWCEKQLARHVFDTEYDLVSVELDDEFGA